MENIILIFKLVFKFPFLWFGLVGGVLFYIWSLYMITGIVILNMPVIELVTFGLIKTPKQKERKR